MAMHQNQLFQIANMKGTYCMWQYTSSGSINGIQGRVDFNAYFSSHKTGPTNR